MSKLDEIMEKYTHKDYDNNDEYCGDIVESDLICDALVEAIKEEIKHSKEIQGLVKAHLYIAIDLAYSNLKKETTNEK